MKTNNLKTIALLVGLALSLFTSYTWASVASYTNDQDGVTFTLDRGMLKIKICKEDIIEVKYTSLNSLESKNSLVIVNDWKPAVKFAITEKSGEIIISTSRLKIKVNKSTNSIRYPDLNDAVILSEDENAGKQV